MQENRRFLHFKPHVKRNGDEKNRDNKRDSPPGGKTVGGKACGAHRILQTDNDGERNEKSERSGNLNKAGVKPALLIRHVLGDINRRAAVFSAERETLQNANQNKQNRRENSDLAVSREKSDRRGRPAHQKKRHEKRVFPPDQIADASEKQRAERTHDKTDGKGDEIGDERESVISRRVKKRRDGCRQTPENIKVIPLDNRSRARRAD